MIDRLQSLRLIPVVALQRAEDAEPLADALCAGGLPCAEITLRTDAARAVRSMSAMISRVMLTGSDGLSVNPAANEINLGRTRASRISHVIAGSAVRWPSSESALPFIRGEDDARWMSFT